MPTLVLAETDERDGLLKFLEAQRASLRRAVLGLTDEQAMSKPSVSGLSLGGLLKHVTSCERGWIQETLLGRPPAKELGPDDWGQDFEPAEGETVAEMLEEYAVVARATEEAILGLPTLEATVPLPEAPWFPPGMRVSARWIMLHLIEEVARHAGHADIIRESSDGRTSYVLIAEEQGSPY